MNRRMLPLAGLLLAGLLFAVAAPTVSAQSAVDCPNTVRAVNGCDHYTPARIAPVPTLDATVPVSSAGGALSVLYAPSEADDPAYRAAIAAAIGGGAVVDYFDASLGTPSVAQMQTYDAVYTWANFAYNDEVAFGDNLATYVDGGGAVILGTFTTYDIGNSLGGAIRGPAYSPVANPTGNNLFFSSTYAGDGTIFYSGVSTATECLFRDTIVPQGSGAVDGTFVDATIMGAYRPDFQVMFMNGDGASALGCTGDWAQLLANMVLQSNSGGPSCDLDLSATINGSTFNQGDVIEFDVTVSNTSASTVLAALRLVATGPANQTVNFGQANVPGGFTASRTFRVRIPAAAPNGSYNLTLELDADGADCDTESFAITVTGPSAASGSTAFELVDGTFASASAVAGTVGVSPNPFVNQAAISFEVAEAAPVRLAVYDVLGREVAVLVDGTVEAGAHSATFDARGLAAGTYVYRLVVGTDVQTGRMTLAH